MTININQLNKSYRELFNVPDTKEKVLSLLDFQLNSVRLFINTTERMLCFYMIYRIAFNRLYDLNNKEN
jgi:hypothetical protein